MILSTTIIITIAFYSLLSFVCLLHLVSLYWDKWAVLSGVVSRASSVEEYIENSQSSYRMTSQFRKGTKVFFIVLFLSSTFDIPFVVGCYMHGSPGGCQWDNIWYFITYSMHLLALVGYFICLGIPLRLWYNLILGIQERFLSATFFLTGIFFMLVLAEIATLITVGPGKYNKYSEIVRGIEAFFYVFIAFFWAIRGLYLVYYLKGIMSENTTKVSLLFNATMIMLIICLSYLFRAGLIMATIFGAYAYFADHYAFWLIGTRWLTYIVSSFLLILVMRLSYKSFESRPASIPITSVFSSISERHDSYPMTTDSVDFDMTRQQTNYFDDSGSNFSLFWVNLINKAPKDRLLGEIDETNEAFIQ